MVRRYVWYGTYLLIRFDAFFHNGEARPPSCRSGADRLSHEEMNFHYLDGGGNFLVQPYAEAVVSGMLL